MTFVMFQNFQIVNIDPKFIKMFNKYLEHAGWRLKFLMFIFSVVFFNNTILAQKQNNFNLGYISGYEVVYKLDDAGNWIAYHDDLRRKKGTFFKPVGEIFIDDRYYTLSFVRPDIYVYWKPVEKMFKGEKSVRFIPYYINSDSLNDFFVQFYPDLRELVWKSRK